jgi:hypothetical protein
MSGNKYANTDLKRPQTTRNDTPKRVEREASQIYTWGRCRQAKGEVTSKCRRIYLPLSKKVFVAMQVAMSSEYRHPRDQPCWLLCGTLELDADSIQENANRDAMDSDPQRAAVARDFSCPSETTALCLRQGRQTETGHTTSHMEVCLT